MLKVLDKSCKSEKGRRVQVSLWAYAYEIENNPMVSDSKFDEVSKDINTDIQTGNVIFDNFFKKEFSPCTGMWIWKHPDIEGIANIYKRLLTNRPR